MKNINKECSPHLIFPEFVKKKWNFLPLKNIATIRNERAGNKKCILLSVSSGIGLISQKEKFGREIAGKQYERYFLVYENDFVYNKSATKTYPQGTINLYYNKDLAAVPSSIFMCFYVDFNIINVFYLKYLFEFNIHGKWLKNFITTGARAHGSFNIDSKDFLSIPIPIPLGEKSLSEQQKIADCLSSLDELIEAHEQKLDALKQHKKGLMQRLFPAEGETTPRWRFPEFRNAGEWENIALGKLLMQSPDYGVNAPAVPYSSTLPTYIRITDISDNGKFIKEKMMSVNIEVTEKNYLHTGDIVLARTGASVGKSYKYQETDGSLVFAGFLIRISPDINKSNSEFINQFFHTQQYWNWVHFTSMRSGQPGINGTEYASLPVPIPSLPEQQKIADCLTSIDEQIEAQKEKIKALKEHKKGMMQQLFPSL